LIRASTSWRCATVSPDHGDFADGIDQSKDEVVREIRASEAKTHLPQILDEVERGETIVITRHGRPFAALGQITLCRILLHHNYTPIPLLLNNSDKSVSVHTNRHPKKMLEQRHKASSYFQLLTNYFLIF
jgi:Antitoxin Phd_YefM, type II toxin-antitoxin system